MSKTARWLRFVGWVWPALLQGCVVNTRPLAVPRDPGAVVLLVSTEMPAPIDTIARHCWFTVREGPDQVFRRIEFGGFGSGPFEGVSGERLHAVWTGERAERAIRCLDDHAGEFTDPIDEHYLPWPGPNSNTYVDRLLRKCKLHADLPATAIGKDYRGPIGVSRTSGGTGVQLESPLLGLRVGLKEGIEGHLLVFALGVDVWPPAIILPIGPGRVGFEDVR